jgi:hypothetical protein
MVLVKNKPLPLDCVNYDPRRFLPGITCRTKSERRINFDAIRFKDRLEFVFEINPPSFTKSGLTRLVDSIPARCREPRDRVFGNIGLINKIEGDMGIQVNYQRPVSEVYSDLVLKFLAHHKRLEILSCCEMQEGSKTSPTWAPNWNNTTEKIWFGWAHGDTPARAEMVGDGVLRAAGIHIGIIQSAIKFNVENSRGQDNIIEEIQRIASILLQNTPADARETVLKAYCRTLSLEQLRNRTGSLVDPLLESILDFIQSDLRSDSVGWQILNPTASDVNTFLRRAAQTCRNRTFITTSTGNFGLGPPAAKEGDKVCVILGCTKPLVVRSIQESKYEIIGESFVHGFMRKEAVLGPFPEDLKRPVSPNAGEADNKTDQYKNHDPRHEKFMENGKPLDLVQIGYTTHFPALTVEKLKAAGIKVVNYDFV